MLDGVWHVNVNVAPQNLAKALKSTREEIDEVRAAKASPTTRSRCRRATSPATTRSASARTRGVASALVTAEKFGFGPRYLDEFPSRIRAVTTAQVNAAMRRALLRRTKLHVIVAGDLDKLPD